QIAGDIVSSEKSATLQVGTGGRRRHGLASGCRYARGIRVYRQQLCQFINGAFTAADGIVGRVVEYSGAHLPPLRWIDEDERELDYVAARLRCAGDNEVRSVDAARLGS